ncbi:MAG: DUF899 family protein [Pseudomonadales bacterium]
MQHAVVNQAQWLAARAELLKKEKAHTHARAELAAARRELPWVKVDKRYEFTGPNGRLSFSEIFLHRSQLVIYHLMFGPDWEAPCPGCTQWANAFNGTTADFKQADARLIAVSRAPYDEIREQHQALGWEFTWLSSFGSDFNYDYYASSKDETELSSTQIGTESGELVEFDRGENHGVSVFYKDADGEVFHTYSAYNRGIEALNGAMGYFDLLPKGRAW